MEVDLPIVGIGVDYTKVGPIHPKKSLALVNYFLANTCHFLNKFSGVSEKKLEDLNGKIDQMEAILCILEAKLASIPGLENVSINSVDSELNPSVITDITVSNETSPPPPPLPIQTEPTEENNTETNSDVAEAKMTISQDPRYAKYLKMIQVGVPPEALRQKMLAENLDPELLKNPQAPLPNKTSEDDSWEADAEYEKSSKDSSD